MTTYDFYNELIGLHGALFRFAMKLTSNKEDAEDLTQDTFLRALTFRDQFEESTNLRAWVYTIMKNVYINNYRKRTVQNIYFDKSTNTFLLDQAQDTCHALPDSTLREKEITMAIDCLNDNFKVPFVMHIQGYKYKDIANKLKLKLGTVKSRIFLTRKKLAQGLSDYNTVALVALIVLSDSRM